MGSPDRTKMADFVGVGRVPEIDGAIADTAAAAIQDRAGLAWAPASLPVLPLTRSTFAERYWQVVHADGPWEAEFRFTGE